MKLKHIIHSQAYGAMISWTHLVEKSLDSNGLMNHSTGLHILWKKNANDNSLTNLSHTANFYPSYVLTDKYLRKKNKNKNKEDLLS